MRDAFVNPVDHPIADVLQHRWSPRAFDETAVVSDEQLDTVLEAARWAPSAYNNQPWRFIVAHRGSDAYQRITDTLVDFNKAWAPRASVLIAAIAELETADGTPIPTAAYDLGQSVSNLVMQAHRDGLFAHQMSGFDADALAQSFDLADTLQPIALIALGTLGERESLPENLQQMEPSPRERRPLAETVLVRQ